MAVVVTEVEPTVDALCVVDLNGEFHFKADAKGRVQLPAKFRKVLSTDLVVTTDPRSECVYVFQTPDYNRWVNQLFDDRYGGFDATSKEHVDLRLALKASARDVEVDAQGRIMIPQDVRLRVGIDKDVVVVGNTGRCEIWDAKRYEDKIATIDLSVFFS